MRRRLDYYDQALPIIASGGCPPPAEAATLTNIGSLYSNLGEAQKALDYSSQAFAPSCAT